MDSGKHFDPTVIEAFLDTLIPFSSSNNLELAND
jgi:response regulator RpfG family c-di-GMP phosphodiesterase